jgi:hypothetical protein|nr:HNH endonuclease signature motif containing protein [Mycobacterium gordonae]
MSAQICRALADLCPALMRGGWSASDLYQVSLVSRLVTGGAHNEQLIHADLALNDALWRLLSLVDPFRIDEPRRYRYATIFSKVRKKIAGEYALPVDEADELAKPIASFLCDYSFHLKRRSRHPIDKATRAELLDLVDPARCWYCGAEFGASSVDAFLTAKPFVSELPRYLDFVTQRGRIPRDFQIEVDHVVPVVAGGRSDIDNLRLACGWCNASKRDHQSLYDAQSRPSIYVHPRAGEWLLPAKFWVIRVIGTRRRCEWPNGCQVTPESGRLFVAPQTIDGSMTPGNLGCYCREHDPIGDVRWVPNDAFSPARAG